ncbi:sensor histidine kinase [Paenibacillus protaetiae]|uniref:Sensor histidine kinase n=1 Tax=Paenibacillus protaetiae TaxID=2509456 RepID=A0A4P6EUR5_9BACL|nr:sensor histidine kinase [Paenibacillus protaetiae]QAY65389.1 sensor histidine kinase [Paenibacillus protaetiae]
MVNPFKRYRIDYLFFGSIAALIVAILGCTIWASYVLTSNEMVKATSDNQQKLLDQLNSEIALRLVTLEQISLSTSRDTALLSFLNRSEAMDQFTRLQKYKEVQQSLANLTYSIPLIQGIDLYMDNPFQSEQNSYIQFRDLKKASSQNWYAAMQKNDSYWAVKQTISTFQGNVNVISFVRSIEYNNHLLGYLVLHAKAQTIEEMLAGTSQDANRMMLDESGQPIISIGSVPDAKEWASWKNKLNDSSGLLHLKGEHRGEVLLVYSKTKQSNWTMVEVTPWSTITKGSLRLAFAIGLIGVAAIVLALILALWVSRQFTSPIYKLVSVMKRYTLSGKKEELPEDYRNEFGFLFTGYRKQMERIEELYKSLEIRHEQLRKAELESLQANINPHFLYNTLDQLNWMAIGSGQHEMSRILELMGRMFRIGLSNGESFITIADELEHIGCYLEIQRIRLGQGLEYEIEADETVRRLFTPKMLLQPFVENSVMHGFHASGKGKIWIKMRIRDGRLVITVEDDGIGLNPEPKPRKMSKTGGYGVRNVRERIRTHFGEPYDVELLARPEGGTIVEIVIPVLHKRPGTFLE